MKLIVVSHKQCWPSEGSPTGYATDGGFPFQIRALSELFAATTLMVPCLRSNNQPTETLIAGNNISIQPLSTLGAGRSRRMNFPVWVLRNIPSIVQEVWRADAVHAPIPGDVGTIGILVAFLLRKPLLVRHCGNWFVQRSTAERFWRWLMEKLAGGRNVMLATGGAVEPPSTRNPNVRWIFSTTLTQRDLTSYCSVTNRVPSVTPRLIIVSRQEKGKGTELIIQAMPQILEAFPRTSLDVVGSGEALPELRQLAHNVGVSSHVIFHGKVNHEQVMSLLRQADLFCFPTSSEGFPKVVLEALACGVPVITTRVSVLPELVAGCGVLLEKNSATAIADAVKSCLSDEVRYQAMSARAVETAKRYSLEEWRDTIGQMLSVAWGPLKSGV